MNTELLEKIAAHIEAHPETYSQGTWCGTACCIAGHACVLSGVKAHSFSAEDKARKLLGISYDESNRLFIIGPAQFDHAMWHGATPEIRAKAGAARIRHFIKTKGAE